MLRDVLADCDDARDAPGGHDVNPIRLRVARYFVAGLFERLATEGRHEELERETIEQLELLESSTDPYDRAWSRARLLDVFELTERYDDVIARLSHDIANRTSLSHAHAIVRRNLARHHIGIDEFDAVDESYAQELTDTDVDLRATMQWAHDTVDFGPDAERTVDWFAQVLDLAEFRLIEARPDEVVVLLDLLIDDDGTPLLFRMPPRHRHRADALRSRARYLLDATHARAERPDDDPTDSQTRWTDASLTRWTAFVDDAGDPSDHGPSSATAVTERARLAEALESRGDSMSALEQYEEILAAIEAKPLLERKWLFHVCQEVSRLSLDCNDTQRAIVMCERTLSLFDAGLPPNVRAWGTSEFDLEEVLLSGSLRPLNRAGLQMRLASALLSDGRLDEADEMCHSAVEAAAGAFGRENLQRRVLADLHDEIRRAREVVAASEPG